MEDFDKGILYIIMRTDLPSLNPGKAMAQASHASSMLVSNKDNYDKNMRKLIDNWINEGNGFGTTVVMETPHPLDITQAISRAMLSGIKMISDSVVDDTYPFLMQKELWRLLHPSVQSSLGITILDKEMDRFGMLKATRKETTCWWIFVNYDDVEKLKEVFKENNITLAL